MSGTTIAQTAASLTVAATAGPRAKSYAPNRAAREMGLQRREFDLAVRLGLIRTVPDEGGGGARRVARAEIDRVRGEDGGAAELLRQRVRTVGTAEGAALMEVTPTRFTRLARLGLVVPVNFYVNRYRAVVWLYLADELRRFTDKEDHAKLLTGRTPEGLRDQLSEGLDLRPRNWRGRHLGFLLRQTEDPWARAAIVASFLDPVHVADTVKDPYERALLNRLRPEPAARTAPDSPAAHVAAEIMTAQEPDEIGWLRADLAQTVATAREARPAPRPASGPASPDALRPAAPHVTEDTPPEREAERSRGFLGWLRRRGA
ncbi:DUF6397 family protein [Streptomyces sp. NPDC059786]|uniref:DUF6397 family protein n=1 Tax=Streptomyces sp. NPDC059786 TaxID=3346946 RepID=UPI003649B1CA